MAEFKKATKKSSKIRAAVFGPSGSGKTFTSLRMAKGIGGKVAVIDTERGRASKYSDRFDFDVCELMNKSVADYIEAIESAADYDVLIIDSLSHEWQHLLGEIFSIAQAKYRGNKWSAWSEGTPKHNRFVDFILDFPGHVICTMRSRTEWVTEKDERTGKTKPVAVGLTPVQRQGIEFEFDILMQIDMDHVATVMKDTTGKFEKQEIEKPGEEFGKALLEWITEGVEETPKEKKSDVAKQIGPAKKAALERGVDEAVIDETIKEASGGKSSKDCSLTTLKKVLSAVQALQAPASTEQPEDDGSGPSRLEAGLDEDNAF
jgi:hypothetical protein